MTSLEMLGSLFHQQRLSKGISQKELAKQCGTLTDSRISRLEKGVFGQTSILEIFDLGARLGINASMIAYTLGYSDERQLVRINELTDDEAKEVQDFVDFLINKRTRKEEGDIANVQIR